MARISSGSRRAATTCSSVMGQGDRVNLLLLAALLIGLDALILLFRT
jgi:hypothetical protein